MTETHDCGLMCYHLRHVAYRKSIAKWYSGMLTQMRNNASQNIPGAYPPRLALAFSMSSNWISEGKFNACDVTQMVAHKPTGRKRQETAYVQTVSENLVKYTKGEVEGAKRARELLSKMGYPSVQMAISMCLRIIIKLPTQYWGKMSPRY